MKLIGITGGIGSGKSTIAKALQKRGYEVYDTDSRARLLMATNPCVRSQIELLFGSDIYCGDQLNRAEVARQVFADKTLLDKLNHIVHPAVGFDLKEWYAANNATQRLMPTDKNPLPLCFVESAILFESGLNRLCTSVVCITAPLNIRISRTMQRDGCTKEEVLRRMRNQMDEQERMQLSDLAVNNDGTASPEQLCDRIIAWAE